MEEARRLFEVEVDYNGALEIFRAVAEDEDAPPEERQEARLQAAFCLVALDRMDEAHVLMVEALIEDPDYELPPYTSPKLVEALEEARMEAVELAESTDETIVADNADPADEPGSDGEGGSEGDSMSPLTTAPSAPSRGGSSLWPYSAALGGAAAAALGTGAYFAISAQRSEDRLLNDPGSFASQQEALEFRESAISRARSANWLLVAGAVLAAGSGAIFFLGDSDGSVGATPTPDGLTLTATGRW